ncbi:MAG: hypothetical protein R3Y12_00360 [Clostridia bacterium]
MKFKRMPDFNLSSPLFMIIATFFMCGAVFGAFSSSFVPNFSIFTYEYQTKTLVFCFFDAVKYNICLIFFSRFLGFLLPLFVMFRGYLLSFSIGVLYANSAGFFDKSVLIESISYNFFAIPCFLIISTVCFETFLLNRKKKHRVRGNSSKYKSILLLILINFGWNIACMSIF